MNKKQKIVLWVGIAIFVLMELFPPWMAANPQGGNYIAAGYGFILNPPHFQSEELWRCRIDFPQLLAQWAMVAVVTGGLIYAFKDEKDKKPKDEQKQ